MKRSGIFQSNCFNSYFLFEFSQSFLNRHKFSLITMSCGKHTSYTVFESVVCVYIYISYMQIIFSSGFYLYALLHVAVFIMIFKCY